MQGRSNNKMVRPCRIRTAGTAHRGGVARYIRTFRLNGVVSRLD